MGRPKGSQNKAPIAFRDKLRLLCERKGVDPFEFMLDCLQKRGLEHQHKIACAKELVKYLEPQLRSIEVSGPGGGPIAHQDRALETRLTAVLAELERQRQLPSPEPVKVVSNGHA